MNIDKKKKIFMIFFTWEIFYLKLPSQSKLGKVLGIDLN